MRKEECTRVRCAALTPFRSRFAYRKLSKAVAKMLWDVGARLYTMPSQAHSQQHITRLLERELMMLEGIPEASQTCSRGRQSWS